MVKEETHSLTNEVAGVLSSIWIIACNDENPIITYKSIRKRLGLSDDYPVETLVSSRGELFRLGAPDWRLEELRAIMHKGGNLPSWFLDFPKEERPSLIDGITSDVVFRSQFRVNRSVEQSPVEIIEWGLQHIDRLRKSFLEEQEVRHRWVKEWLIPVMSILVAITAVVSSSFIQYFGLVTQESSQIRTIESTEKLKKYEVSFAQRTTAYSKLMDAVDSVQKSALSGNTGKVLEDLHNVEAAFHQLRPFLSLLAQREFISVNAQHTKFITDISSRQKSLPLSDEDTAAFSNFKIYFADTVYSETFERSPYVQGPIAWPVR